MSLEAWGPGPFDNRAADDWTRLLEQRGLQAIRDALGDVRRIGSEYLSAEVGARGIAAAEVIARWRHRATTGFDLVDGWLAMQDEGPDDALLSQALEVVRRVSRPPSELWGMRDGDAEWQAIMTTLQTWLTATELSSQGVVPAGWAGITPNEQPRISPLNDDEQLLTRRDQALVRALRKAGVDLSRPRLVLQHLYFTSEADARAAARQADEAGWGVEVTPPSSTMAAWALIASLPDHRFDPANIAAATTFFDALARTNDGLNDGWEVPVKETPLTDPSDP